MIDTDIVVSVDIVPLDDEWNGAFPEHKAPAKSKIARHNISEYGPNVCYITPPAGARFGVRCTMHTKASFMGQTDLRVSCKVDSQAESWSSIHRPRGRARQKTLTKTLDRYKTRVEGLRREVHYSFAPSKINHADMGKIEVKVDLGYRRLTQSRTGRWFTPARGEVGKKTKFVIFYTSMEYLVARHIISAPTASSNIKLEADDEDDASASVSAANSYITSERTPSSANNPAARPPYYSPSFTSTRRTEHTPSSSSSKQSASSMQDRSKGTTRFCTPCSAVFSNPGPVSGYGRSSKENYTPSPSSASLVQARSELTDPFWTRNGSAGRTSQTSSLPSWDRVQSGRVERARSDKGSAQRRESVAKWNFEVWSDKGCE